ncbi:MAG TPA: cation:proton antiporter, partial [Accumulibacter sp.]|nr:cation:proton antiporter [Accumulibacter sp.]
MLNGILSPARTAWEGLQERLFFLPPFPDELDSLALFSMLLVVGLLFGEWLRAKLGWPKVIGYVLAGTLFGPSVLGWISIEALAQIRPMADAALGLLMLEIGRRLDLRWLGENRDLLRATLGEITLSFTAIFLFAWGVVGLMAAWAAAAAAVTMASAPAVVLLTVEESNAQGQVSERIILHTALSAAASFVVFAVVVGIVHAQYSDDWLNAVAHPPWVVVGSVMIAWLMALLARLVAALLRKRSLAQVFILVATALLAVGTARMLAVPVFLTLFLMGVILSFSDQERTLSYTNLPEGHWFLAIILFVVVGASLPWQDF